MKRFSTVISLAALIVTSSFLVSCGGDTDGSGNVANSDTAPATLDATSLQIFSEGMNFQFTRTSGDATDGQEQGACAAISQTSSDVDIVTANGNNVTYELPSFVSNISYTYEKTSSNSGLIVITGDGSGDGDNVTEVDFDGDGVADFFFFDILDNFTDIFVNQAANNDEPFIATIRISFGSSGAIVENVSLDINLIGTSSALIPDLDFFVSTTNNDGAIFTLQDGSSVPIRYDLTDSSGVVTEVEVLAPELISAAGQLLMTFDGDGGDANIYELNGISSDDQGFPTASDQGIYDLEVTNFDGTTLGYSGIPFAWTLQSNAENRGLLTLLLPENGQNVSHQFVFFFDSTEAGRFIQIQPDTNYKGSFSLPFRDTENN